VDGVGKDVVLEGKTGVEHVAAPAPAILDFIGHAQFAGAKGKLIELVENLLIDRPGGLSHDNESTK
jgi:hypothetical protein